MTTWHRAVDTEGRFYVLGIAGDQVSLYFPDIAETQLRYKDGGIRSHDLPVRCWRMQWPLARLDDLKKEYGIVDLGEATMRPGVYYPRIYRGTEHPPVDVAARTATMRAARSLFARLRDVFQIIEPTKKHDSVYGHELRQLLILACTEVESSWRAVLKANRYPAGKARWTTRDYVKLKGPMRLQHYGVTLASHPGYPRIIWPFADWDPKKATESLSWYDAYNATKHNREDELRRATLRSVIDALGAVHVMTAAQFGFEEVERGHFHADEFNFFGSPGWMTDSYIRPLLPPNRPLSRPDQWPSKWSRGRIAL